MLCSIRSVGIAFSVTALLGAFPAGASEGTGSATLSISDCYVQTGETVEVKIENAPAGARVILAGALDDGPITFGSLTVCLGPSLGAITEVGRQLANGSGEATFTLPVPTNRPALVGKDIFFQAFVPIGPGVFDATNGDSFHIVDVGTSEPIFEDASGQIADTPHSTTALELGDFDLDGDVDAISLASLTLSPDALQILVNQGGAQGGTAGEFADETAFRVDVNGVNDGILDGISLVLEDLTGDTFPDIVIGGDDFSDPNGAPNRPNYFFVNDGNGNFIADSNFPAGLLETQSLAAADLNGDGATDLILGNGADRDFPEAAQVLLNDPNDMGNFTLDTNFPTLNGEWDDVVVADVDGINGLDLFLVNDGQNRLLLNDGFGTFTDATVTNLPVLDDNSSSGPAGDIDGDGDPDFVVINIGNPSYWLENDADENPGLGVFTQRILPSLGPELFLQLDGALADFDQDDDLDILFATHTFGNGETGASMLVNQGGIQGGAQGTFAKHTTFDSVPLPTVTNAIRTADVDNDGDEDIMIGNSGDFAFPTPNEDEQLLLNRGCGAILP